MASSAKAKDKKADANKAVQLVMYLATQPEYVSIHDILADKLSGFTDREELKEALRKTCDALDVKSEPGEASLYRLPRTFDGYKDAYELVKDSEEVYNFLSSNYSHAMVNELFIRDALIRMAQTPFYESLAEKYPPNMKPGDAMVMMMAQQPGFAAIAALFSISPAVAEKLLYPEKLSKYELTHPKIMLDLTFAADMVKRAPPGTVLSVKYEILAQGMVNLEIRGGSGIP